MALLDTIGNFFGSFWIYATDFITLIFVILYIIVFFIVQYYLIKGYIWLIKFIYERVPFVRDFFIQKWKNNKFDSK